jgi:hypothetical protein
VRFGGSVLLALHLGQPSALATHGWSQHFRNREFRDWALLEPSQWMDPQ